MDLRHAGVEIRSQPRRGSSPTFSISALLKAGGYRFDSLAKRWWKSVAEGEAQKIRNEVWVEAADGIEVRLVDREQGHRAVYGGS